MAKKSFEQAMRQLEKIIQEMESGDLPLEKAMNKFEEGMRLTQFCSQKLNDTEKKIQVLLKDHQGEEVTYKPFAVEDGMDD
jgi:exodeoxyribonuclease VII small subunit